MKIKNWFLKVGKIGHNVAIHEHWEKQTKVIQKVVPEISNKILKNSDYFSLENWELIEEILPN